VSVVVPAHNEEGNIDKLVEEFDKTFHGARLHAEVILIDDGSTDDTGRKIANASRRYPFVRRLKNRTRMGLTATLSRGFAAAKGDILVFYPADLQFHPHDIPRMVTAIENGADMICGKKVGAYGKWLVSKFYNLLTRLLFPKLKISDLNSVKAFRRQVYEDFPTMREGWHRYLPVFAVTKGYMVREIPVKLYARLSGKSKFSGRKRILKGLTDLIAVKFQISVLGDPMYIFGKIALWLLFFALLSAGTAFVLRFGFDYGYRPLLYVVIMFGLGSLFTFVIGIVVETLVYLRDSLKELQDENANLTVSVNQLESQMRRSASKNGGQEQPRKEQVRKEQPRQDNRSPRRRHSGPPRRDTRQHTRGEQQQSPARDEQQQPQAGGGDDRHDET
jgi:glycosyltransferase involved in cell wall biosynthesis